MMDNGIYIRDKQGRFKKVLKASQASLDALEKLRKEQRKKRVKIVCEICKKEFYVIPARVKTAKTCSPHCRGKYVGRKRRENATPILWSGYMFIKMPSYHRVNKQGYAKIADLVLERTV